MVSEGREINERLEKKEVVSFVYNPSNFLFTATLDTGVNLGPIFLMKSLNQGCSWICMGSPLWPHKFRTNDVKILS